MKGVVWTIVAFLVIGLVIEWSPKAYVECRGEGKPLDVCVIGAIGGAK